MEGKLTCPKGLVEKVDERPTEEAAENFHWEEESRRARYPARAVIGQASAWNDAMKMWVEVEILAPSVEHGEKTDSSPQMLGVSCDRGQRLRHGLEEDGVHATLVLKSHVMENVGQREDHVKVGHVEKVLTLRIEPLRSRGSLTLRAMSISAGIV
jgi:hypothetical protein